MRVEYLRAHENGTWDTEVIEVPLEDLTDLKVTEAGDDAETLTRWAMEHVSGLTKNRRVVLWAVYALPGD
jgi:hypothetical protein